MAERNRTNGEYPKGCHLLVVVTLDTAGGSGKFTEWLIDFTEQNPAVIFYRSLRFIPTNDYLSKNFRYWEHRDTSVSDLSGY